MTETNLPAASPKVLRYWNAVANMLRVESQEMAGLITHAGLTGTANENSFQERLAKVLPPSVRLSTGELIDSNGAASAQMDTLVLSNTSHPVLFGQTEEMMFPVEAVLLCVEVKTSLNKSEVEDIAKKIRKHKKLMSSVGERPVFAVFAHKAGAAPRTVAKWFFDLPEADRPAFFLVNDAAIFGIADSSAPEGYCVSMPFSPGIGEPDTTAAGDPTASDVNYWKPVDMPAGDHVRIDHGASMLLFVRAVLNVLSEQGYADLGWFETYVDKVRIKQVMFDRDGGSILP